MISLHPSFLQPQDTLIKVWRYMDLSKFVALLQTHALYFPRADVLGDPFEGSITKAEVALRELMVKNREFANRLGFADMAVEEIVRMNSVMSAANKSKVREIYVSCWHMNEHESAAMWRLYGKSDDTVCLQTTYNTLSDVLPRYINAGLVQYLDYDHDFIQGGNIFNSLMCKRISFAHEREVRAVAWSIGHEGKDAVANNIKGNGLLVQVDLDRLVKSVYVSPTSPPWLRDVVEGLLRTYSLQKPVLQSALANSPLW